MLEHWDSKNIENLRYGGYDKGGILDFESMMALCFVDVRFLKYFRKLTPVKSPESLVGDKIMLLFAQAVP